MNIDELNQAAFARGWKGALRVPGQRGQDRGDNLYVVDRDAEGWYVAFLERGELDVLHRCADEDEAATAAYRHLRRAYEGALPSGPSVAPAAEPARNASGEGWITWTSGKDD